MAYFLDECAAEQAYPGFGHAVSVLCAKELMEENAMVQWLEWLLKRLGTKHFLSCLKDTIRLCSSGGKSFRMYAPSLGKNNNVALCLGTRLCVDCKMLVCVGVSCSVVV